MYYAIIRCLDHSGCAIFQSYEELVNFEPKIGSAQFRLVKTSQQDEFGIIQPLAGEKRFSDHHYKAYRWINQPNFQDRIRQDVSLDHPEIVAWIKNHFPHEIPRIAQYYFSIDLVERIEQRLEEGFLNAEYINNRPPTYYVGNFKTPQLVSRIIKYCDSHVPFGYLGHSNRNIEMDCWFEDYLSRYPEETSAIGDWICSGPGRYMMDNCDTLDEFLVQIPKIFKTK